MIRISSTPRGSGQTLPMQQVEHLISAIGTQHYGATCLQMLDEALGIDHWALFQYCQDGDVRCVISASRIHVAAAQANVQQFVKRCHRVDPSLMAIRRQQPSPACVAQMQVGDIRDRQYRHCFEVAGVQERISFFVRIGTELHQLSIYRGSKNATLTAAAIEYFAALAAVIVASGTKHAWQRAVDARALGPLDVERLEQLLCQLPSRLSEREREVCARAAVGRTIDHTAAELNIGRTSVVTYRQRAYEKLRISRQGELIALINHLRPGNA